MSANAVTRLLQHYVDNFRRLPWRSPPGAPPPEPYRVWLSEIMLQQTTVATVVPRFTRFVDRWPTVEALARAPETDVLQEWAGLGYYARARNLIACAREVAKNGGFPSDELALRNLPGIGDYTAAAIAAIAFGAEATPIDTNVERVVGRLEALTGKAAIRTAARAMTPPHRAGDFAQAVMDLGASICRPRAPHCGQCPLASDCQAFEVAAGPTDQLGCCTARGEDCPYDPLTHALIAGRSECCRKLTHPEEDPCENLSVETPEGTQLFYLCR